MSVAIKEVLLLGEKVCLCSCVFEIVLLCYYNIRRGFRYRGSRSLTTDRF